MVVKSKEDRKKGGLRERERGREERNEGFTERKRRIGSSDERQDVESSRRSGKPREPTMTCCCGDRN